MAKLHWKERFAKGGVCDFRENYDFYFKWLLNKVQSCFVIRGLPDTINPTFLKTNLILNGNICITDFKDKLYAVYGSIGGQPNEYYIPRNYVVANPVLGSKSVTFLPEDGNTANGVVITNTAIDGLFAFEVGLYELINQTATLLADNIISISCNQINSRVVAFFTGESDAQCTTAETTLKQMYAGRPYVVLRSDIVEKLNVNPISASVGQNLTELVELHNYIIGNFFQSIGIKSNNIRKKAHVLNEEIDSQNEFLKVSIMEMLTSWQSGFDKVNELYGTDIEVTLNPALVDTVLDNNTESNDFSPEMQETISNSEEVDNTEYDDTADEDTAENETNSEEISSEKEDSEDIISDIEEKQEDIVEIIELAQDTTESEVAEEDDDKSEEESSDVAES